MTLAGVGERFVEVDGLRLHVLDWGGDGPLVFCIHANGYLAAMWHPIARELTAQARVVGVDLPGHGDSDPAPDYRWDHLSEYVAGVLQALGLGPALLVGHSIGGTLSAICAARHPELVRAMVLADAVVLPEPFYQHPESMPTDLYGTSRRRRSWPSREAMRESLASKATYARWRPEMLDLFVAEGTRESDPDGYGGQVTLKCAPETEAEVYRNTLIYNCWPEMARADVLAIVLRGLSSEGLASLTALEVPGRLPRAQDRPLAEASHLLPMEYPEEVVRAVRELLGRVA
ncbi:MAG: alpha/beta hydrolase [Dehalococcoidia bacterium]|jgi:pimeloyl-ACP methyl ester carboxylesterase